MTTRDPLRRICLGLGSARLTLATLTASRCRRSRGRSVVFAASRTPAGEDRSSTTTGGAAPRSEAYGCSRARVVGQFGFERRRFLPCRQSVRAAAIPTAIRTHPIQPPTISAATKHTSQTAMSLLSDQPMRGQAS